MNLLFDTFRRTLPALVVLCAISLFCGCARVSVHTTELPPVLKQDEVLRPYQKVASISVRRERWGAPEDLTPEDYSWAYNALREEAARLGADAVIFPEVKIELQRYLFFPTSGMKAKGIAIKFR